MLCVVTEDMWRVLSSEKRRNFDGSGNFFIMFTFKKFVKTQSYYLGYFSHKHQLVEVCYLPSKSNVKMTPYYIYIGLNSIAMILKEKILPEVPAYFQIVFSCDCWISWNRLSMVELKKYTSWEIFMLTLFLSAQ